MLKAIKRLLNMDTTATPEETTLIVESTPLKEKQIGYDPKNRLVTKTYLEDSSIVVEKFDTSEKTVFTTDNEELAELTFQAFINDSQN